MTPLSVPLFVVLVVVVVSEVFVLTLCFSSQCLLEWYLNMGFFQSIKCMSLGSINLTGMLMKKSLPAEKKPRKEKKLCEWVGCKMLLAVFMNIWFKSGMEGNLLLVASTNAWYGVLFMLYTAHWFFMWQILKMFTLWRSMTNIGGNI